MSTTLTYLRSPEGRMSDMEPSHVKALPMASNPPEGRAHD